MSVSNFRGRALLLIFGIVAGVTLLEGLARLAERSAPSKEGYSPIRGRRAREPLNRAGYRDVEHTRLKPPGAHRAVFLGDSFTYGVGVLLDDTYPKRVERDLAIRRGETWESLVFAVPGIDTEQEEVIFENEALAYDPDLVVLGYVLNDAEDEGAAERRRAIDWNEREEARRHPSLWRQSALLRLIEGRLHATSENAARIGNHLALYEDGAPGFQGVRRSLDRLAELCRARHIPLVVALFPLFANPLDENYPFRSVHEKVAQACRGSKIDLVDLFPYYRGMDWRLLVVEGSADEHPNEIAHRIAAQAIVAAIEERFPKPPVSAHPERPAPGTTHGP